MIMPKAVVRIQYPDMKITPRQREMKDYNFHTIKFVHRSIAMTMCNCLALCTILPDTKDWKLNFVNVQRTNIYYLIILEVRMSKIKAQSGFHI